MNAIRCFVDRSPNQPVDLVFKSMSESDDDHEDYVRGLEHAITLAHDVARSKLKTTQAKMKKDYDLKILEKQYKVGDYVYVLDTAKVKGKNPKLQPSWKGPGIILVVLTPYVYKMKMKGKTINVHHDRLRPCQDRNVPLWLSKYRETLLNEQKDKNKQTRPTYCLCQKPYDGRFMVQCDVCDEWYHGSCIDITPQEAEQLDKFICPGCPTLTPTRD